MSWQRTVAAESWEKTRMECAGSQAGGQHVGGTSKRESARVPLMAAELWVSGKVGLLFQRQS